MAKREKKVIITGVTRESADEAFGAYAKADAQSAKITADIELQCAKIREKPQEAQTFLKFDFDDEPGHTENYPQYPKRR